VIDMIRESFLRHLIDALRDNNSVIKEKADENDRLLNGLILGNFETESTITTEEILKKVKGI